MVHSKKTEDGIGYSYWLLISGVPPPDRWLQSGRFDRREKFSRTITPFQDVVGAVFNRDELGCTASYHRGCKPLPQPLAPAYK